MSTTPYPTGLAVPLRVLIVEDSVDISESLSAALTLQGAERIAVARSSAEAIQWLRDAPGSFDAIVLDLFLHVGSGLDVLQEVRTMAVRPPVAVLTNYATESLRLQCESLGAARVYDKSSEVEKMMAWLSEVSLVVAKART